MTSPDEIQTALVALSALTVTCLTGVLWFVIRAYGQSKAANEAVNNVRPGEHRLYDMVANLEKSVDKLTGHNEDFVSKGWETLPTDIGTSAALTSTIRDLQNAAVLNHEEHKKIVSSLENLQSVITGHDQWEREIKYDSRR